MENDYLVRGMAGRSVRAFAVTGRALTEEARRAHNTSPIGTAALGRLMCGALMMGAMLKGDRDLLTVRIDGDGPMQGLLATADSRGNVKGYVKVPDVILPPNAAGHLNVGGAVGSGTLTVIRDLGLKEPYVGQVPLRSGEIADDLTAYFAVSEQTPSSVGLGVLMNKNNTVREAGGFLFQLMPDAAEADIDRLEQNLRALPPVTELLRDGLTPEQILTRAADGFPLTIEETRPVRFYCDCSREKCVRTLELLGEKELDRMIADGKPADLTCQFCGKSYTFSPDDLREIRRNLPKKTK